MYSLAQISAGDDVAVQLPKLPGGHHRPGTLHCVDERVGLHFVSFRPATSHSYYCENISYQLAIGYYFVQHIPDLPSSFLFAD